MKGYLGEFPVDIAKTKEEWCLEYLTHYSFIDGAHHKMWVMDQMARILLGTPVIATEARWDNGQTEIRFRTGEPSKEYLEWLDADPKDSDVVGYPP